MWKALWNHGIPPVQWGVVIGASLAAGVWDLAKRRIPNVLTATLVASAIVFAPISAGIPGLADALLAGAILATPYILLFIFARGGAGDAKLMAGIGAWLGVINGLVALFCVATAGIFVAVGYSIGRRGGRKTRGDLGFGSCRPACDAEKAQEEDRRTMPFGLAILIGVCTACIGVYVWRK